MQPVDPPLADLIRPLDPMAAETDAVLVEAGGPAAALEDVLERMSDSLFAYDRDWRFVRVNRAGRDDLRSVGVDPAAAIGRTIWELFPMLRGSEYEREMRRSMEERVPRRFEAVAPITGGWLEIQVYPTATGVAAYTRDVTGRHGALEAQRFLSRVGESLAGSLDQHATLQTVARLAVPVVGDYCVVDLVEETGGVRRVATAHRDPARDALLRGVRRFTPRLDGSNFVSDVLRSGQPSFGPTSDAIVRSVADDPEFVEIINALGPESYCCVPMVARDRTLGSLLLVRTRDYERPPFTSDDVALAVELARRAALAVDNSRLYGAEQTARQRTERLQAMTAALAAAVTTLGVAEVVVRHAVDAVGAACGFVAKLSDAGDSVTIVRSIGFSPGHFDRWPRVSLDRRTPLFEAMRRGMPVWVPSAEEGLRLFPDVEAVRDIPVRGAWVSIPLVSGGRVLGGVGLILDEARPATSDELAFLSAVGPVCGQALERAEAFQAEREARADAEEARRRAEEANRAKAEFLAVMSHELRTPLNAIAGYAELIDLGLQGPITEETRGAIARIRRSQRHLLGLIDEVLNFARLDSGRLEFRITDLLLDDTVRSVEPLVAPQIRERGLTFEYAPVPADITARGDREKVQQILLNLLSNAVKFTEPGGRVRVSAELLADAALIRVTDTGIGIPPDKLSVVFEPFVQVDSSLTRTTSGTGLGLSIARQLARGMEGDLTVASTPGAGTTFSLRLPR